jgi:hypothetical protein
VFHVKPDVLMFHVKRVAVSRRVPRRVIDLALTYSGSCPSFDTAACSTLPPDSLDSARIVYVRIHA